MRIGLITPGISAAEDDWCIPALWDLVRALAAVDEVTVFALRYPHRRRPYRLHGATVVPFGTAQRRGAARFLMWRRALVAIRRAAAEGRFDALHALWAHEPGFLAVRAGRRAARRTVVSLMGGELVDLPALGYGGARGTINRWLIRRALAAADAVTAGSASLARLAAPRVAAGRLTVCPLGVDLERFHPGAPDDRDRNDRDRNDRVRNDRDGGGPRLDGEPAILSVGSLVPVKDHQTLLRAFAALAATHPGARLHLLGEGPLRPALEARAAALGIDAAVRFHGAVDHGALPALYRRADLFALASRFESQCLAALEAAACGCPLAGTAVGVLAELGDGAITVAPGDHAALGRCLATLAADPAARAARGRAARDAVLRRFALADTVGAWRRLYAGDAGG